MLLDRQNISHSQAACYRLGLPCLPLGGIGVLLGLLFIIRPFCLPRAVARTQRQVIPFDSPHVCEQGPRWMMFKDTLHTDMHMSSRAREMALVGDIILYVTTAEQHAAKPERGQQRARAMAISPRPP